MSEVIIGKRLFQRSSVNEITELNVHGEDSPYGEIFYLQDLAGLSNDDFPDNVELIIQFSKNAFKPLNFVTLLKNQNILLVK